MQVTQFFERAGSYASTGTNESPEDALARQIRYQLEQDKSEAYRVLREAAEDWILNKDVWSAAWNYGSFLAIAASGLSNETNNY